MQLSAQEEYGLRCLLRVAEGGVDGPVSAALIAEREGISHEYVARLMAPLKGAGLVSATRGAGGGYRLARPADQISVLDAILALGGPFFPEGFCECHPGQKRQCVRSTDCSIRALWQRADHLLRVLFESVSLADFLRTEAKMVVVLENMGRAHA
jgi:Rrf2 family protein